MDIVDSDVVVIDHEIFEIPLVLDPKQRLFYTGTGIFWDGSVTDAIFVNSNHYVKSPSNKATALDAVARNNKSIHIFQT